jgi:N-acetylmuramoyl-L-alanine amidase
VSIGLAAASVARPAAQALRAAAPYAVLSADGRTTVAAVTAGDQEMLRLDDLAALLQLTVREDRAAKALTVSRGTSVVVLSLDQGLASIGGKILSLAAAPVRDGPRWLVSPDTVNRALAPMAGVRMDVRRASRLIVLGDLRVPRITVQQESGGPPTRVAIEVAPRAGYTIVQEPRRLLVRFDADALDVGPLGASGGLVQSVTAADPATLVIALDKTIGTFRASTVPVDAAASRILIDLAAVGAPAPAPSGLARAQPPPAPAAPPPAAAAKPDAVPALPAAQPPGVRTVVIDPGHGGDELGTQSAGGVLEKDLVLDVARRLRTVLDTRLGIRVLLTRDDDRTVPHDERASIANNNKADLFISLHANSSPSASARGAEVYYLSLDGLGAEARRMVESPEARPVPVLGGGSRDIDLILWDMAQARHLNESASFAMLVEEELRRRIEMGPNPIQQAPFRVLVAANMPAVLVEMGFLSNPEQEAQLTSDDFKNKVVQALFDAIVRYRGRIEGQAVSRLP